MSTATASRSEITVEEYLAAELLADEKHEFLGGAVYAMAGASEAHNIIAINLCALLHRQLRGKRCQAFGSDMKVRIHPPGTTYFYYPDAMVACEPEECGGRGWRERPSALFEILSPGTRRVDEREKRVLYQHIPELKAYVMIEQDCAEVVVDRRGPNGWETEELFGLDAVVLLPELELEIPVVELYERVTFPPQQRRHRFG